MVHAASPCASPLSAALRTPDGAQTRVPDDDALGLLADACAAAHSADDLGPAAEGEVSGSGSPGGR